ncbi:hypothetical protein ACSVDA_22115 [Cytobacillus sp. Hm23]
MIIEVTKAEEIQSFLFGFKGEKVPRMLDVLSQQTSSIWVTMV